MKRQLSQTEKELSEKGLKRNKEELELIKLNLEYNKDLIQKQNEARLFDDKWRDYLRQQKDREDKKVLLQIEPIIKETEESIANLTEQLNNGVDVKSSVQ